MRKEEEPMKKGSRLACVPCGREVIVDACGISSQMIWCCGEAMRQKKKSVKTPAKKAAKKR
jgi:hypothetical protein